MVMDALNNNNNPAPSPPGSHCISLTNVERDECFTYSLVLVKGYVPTRIGDDRKLQLHSTLTHGNETTSASWDVHNGEFKCLFDLKRGVNRIRLLYDESTKDLCFEYAPRKTNLRVTPVYIVCQGHDGCFQSPRDVDCSAESACSRIAVGARLIQTIMAEKLHELGLGRKTFQLEHELHPKRPECVVFRSALNVNKARKMKESELWCHFGRELMLSELGSNERKFLAFISCTRFKGMDNADRALTHEEIVSMTEGHAALGGGGLAVFGSACLYTWPTSVAEIVPRFLDATVVDAKRFMDDSCYRGTVGGCFATTLGSVCHELGHTFDLGHTKDGIMGRGFDHIDRVFTVGERRGHLPFKDSNLNFSGKPTQHTTVSLTRSIDVTMNVGEPMRTLGPRSKTMLGISLNERNRGPNVTPINRPQFGNPAMTKSFEAKRSSSFATRSGNDYTYWTKSCGVFLSYHRWFNNEYGREREAITRYLKFDKNKMMILSTAGIRVVEVREEATGMVIDAYEFTENPEKRFLVPFTSAAKNKILVIVVEDDLGNVLKQIFSY